jgi:hypothetical protein
MMAAVRFEVGIGIDAVESGCLEEETPLPLTMPGQKKAGLPDRGWRDYLLQRTCKMPETGYGVGIDQLLPNK